MEEEGSTKRTRGHEEALTSSGFPAQSSSSSGGGAASAGSGVAGGERRGEKRAAEDPAADGREDSVDEKGESKNDEDVSMDCMSFQEYCDTGGLWMVACREPDEDIEEGEGELSGRQAPDQCGMQFHDDRTGKPLVAEKVRAARAEELRELDRRLWEEADLQECWDKKGRAPIGVRWVDVDKGFGVYRSRLVAKDFKPRSKINDKEGLFAATPPLELVKILLMKVARGHKAGNANIRKVMFLDISKAHLYAPMVDEEFVEFPPERRKEGKCARLIYTLYGMRTAAGNWEKEYSKTLEL